MNQQRSHVLLERDAHEVVALGPTFDGPDDPCAACFLRRRSESPLPPGPWQLLDQRETESRVGIAPGEDALAEHQLDGAGGQHRFLPYPDCRCHRAAMLPAPPRNRLAVTELVSARIGIVSSLRQLGAGPPVQVLATGAATVGTGGSLVVSDGTGVADQPADAALRAVSEAVERYAAGFWDHSGATSVTEVGGEAVVGGTVVDDGTSVQLPAASVFLAFPAGGQVQDSVGLAAGLSPQAAAARGLAERIERDVFWDAVAGRAAADEVSRHGSQVRLRYAAPHGHQLVCVLTERTAQPYLTLGLGCALDPDEALHKADGEEQHVCASLERALARMPEHHPVGTRSALDRLLWRVAVDAPSASALLAALTAAAGQPAPAPAPRRYAVVDLTTQDVRACGIHVVRVASCR